MNKIKNPDLVAFIACLLALLGNRAAILWGGGALISQDLEMALGGFATLALARWRLTAKKPVSVDPGPAEPKEIVDPVTAPIVDETVGDSGDDTELAGGGS